MSTHHYQTGEDIERGVASKGRGLANHSCVISKCKRDNYKARPNKPKPYIGLLMPLSKKSPNGHVLKTQHQRSSRGSGSFMKDFPRSERQARRVLLQQHNAKRNKDYYQNASQWKSPRY